MPGTKDEMDKLVDMTVQQIMNILPEEKRHLMGLKAARIYYTNRDYPNAIKYLKLFLEKENVAEAHELMAHSYILLKKEALSSALHHYQSCIQLDPQKKSAIKYACRLLLNEESIFTMDCAYYWLELAASNNLVDDKAVFLLAVQVILNKSNDDDAETAKTSKASRFERLVRSSLHFLNTQESLGKSPVFLRELAQKSMKIIAALASEALEFPKANKEPAVDAFNLPSTSKQAAEPPFLQSQKPKQPKWVTWEENAEIMLEEIAKLHHKIVIKKKKKPAGLDPGNALKLSTSSSSSAPAPEFSFEAPNTSALAFELTASSDEAEAKQPDNKPELAPKEKTTEMSLEDIAKWLQKFSVKEQEKPAGNAMTLSPSSSSGMSSFGLAPAALTGEFSFEAPNTSALASVDQTFELTASADEAKQPDNKPELAPKEKNTEMSLEDIAKWLQQFSVKEQEKPAGNALNLSPSSSSGMSSFGLAPAALPVTGEFSLNSSALACVDQEPKNSGAAVFKFTAPAVAATSASLGLGSSTRKPPEKKIDVKVHELLFVRHAKLYRLTDGDFKKRGQGDVKIYRCIPTKDLHVVMRQDKLLNICLSHPLNADVVYKPMNKKSWVFAAQDFSEGKGAVERFVLRFKTQCEAQEFNITVKKALDGTAKAIQN